MQVLMSWLVIVAFVALTPLAEAAEFTINPLLVRLDRTSRASEIVVRNDDRVPLRMQVQAMNWRQDADGRDQYEPADGLLYFPRAMEIPAGDSRVIRLGVKAAPVSKEESFRVFVEELPHPTAAGTVASGTSLQVVLRVGVPVFVAPVQVDRKGEIVRLGLTGSMAEWVVANTGNVHLRAERVEMVGLAPDGTRLFEEVFQERYFLAGVVKTLRFEIPADKCGQLARLEVAVSGENLDLRRQLDVSPGSCR